MGMLDPVTAQLDRADELGSELEAEYEKCLRSGAVSQRARILTHEVMEKLSNCLDQAAHEAWTSLVAPGLTEADRKKCRVYFPCAADEQMFRSTLGRARISHSNAAHAKLFSFLESIQPYKDKRYGWLLPLRTIANQKHVTLVPQRRLESRQVAVSRPGGGSVRWGSGVRFGPGVSVLGAPIDPTTQLPIPTPGVNTEVKKLVAFVIEGFNINALGFVRDVLPKTRQLICELRGI